MSNVEVLTSRASSTHMRGGAHTVGMDHCNVLFGVGMGFEMMKDLMSDILPCNERTAIGLHLTTMDVYGGEHYPGGV